jgi:hypothetical protein
VDAGQLRAVFLGVASAPLNSIVGQWLPSLPEVWVCKLPTPDGARHAFGNFSRAGMAEYRRKVSSRRVWK